MTSLPAHARACIVFRRSADGSRGDRRGTGLQSIQISPYHAGRAGLRCLRLLCASCCAAMLWSLRPVAAPGRRLTFGTCLRCPTRCSGRRFELSRRTARHERTLLVVACRVEPVVAHPAPPQIRTCAMNAYGSSGRAPTALMPSTGMLLSGFVSSKSLPCLLPAEALPGGRLPSRGSRGPWFPTFTGTMRRYDCHPVLLGGFACRSPSRYLACFHSS